MVLNKKDDHFNLALRFHQDKQKSDFDDLRFVHHVFSDVAVDDVDISTSFAGYEFNKPFYINGMIGGTEKTKEYNKRLAILARETNTFMATGSLSVALTHKEAIESFSIVRKLNPNGIVFANLGADKSLEDAKRAVDILKADGLQLHLNVCQELVMPEGDRDFSFWLDNIENIVNNLGVPVVLKEVGFGMSDDAIGEMIKRGVKTIDIAGNGGTDFARIENFRRKRKRYNFLEGYGNSTVNSLLEAREYIEQVEILSSGGIRNSMDIVKSLALGAKSVGMAARMLNLVYTTRMEKAIEEVISWEHEIKSIMALLRSKDIVSLKKTDIVLKADVSDWANARGIDIRDYGRRSQR
ncbi:MAG: type 2 isopentenyl-diphosphate Delta-isomerase [Tissierellia bacterium]|nr:type 2 isopentenyl-diphosphate Delta-isomerase [Tissierellia bacterium]